MILGAELKKIPFVGVLVKKDEEGGRVSIHWRKQGDQGLLSLDQAISLVVHAASIPVPTEEVRSRVQRKLQPLRCRTAKLKPRRRPSTAHKTGQTLIAAHA